LIYQAYINKVSTVIKLFLMLLVASFINNLKRTPKPSLAVP
jgi:hypothetical protein